MKLALIGYGAMGQLLADEARNAGDQVSLIIRSIDTEQSIEGRAEILSGHDAAIDFSVAATVPTNVAACVRAGVPLVEGTTGWKDQQASLITSVIEQGGAMVYGANFSIGVNVFYRIVQHASALMSRVEAYSPFIEEAHHSRKRDAPSGTAVRLRELMSEHLGANISTASTRAGYIPGTHRVGFDSEADQILLTHEARSRKGFAAGALLAAHWVVGRRGVFEFGEVVDEILRK